MVHDEQGILHGEGHASSAADVMAVFAAAGLRTTQPRRLIAGTIARLAADGQDFTADGLRRQVQAQDPHVGRATVFRALDILLDNRLLERIRFADGSHRFRTCAHTPAHHHHLTCSSCRRIVEVDVCFPDDQLQAIAAGAGFVLDGHAIELFGRCADCRR